MIVGCGMEWWQQVWLCKRVKIAYVDSINKALSGTSETMLRIIRVNITDVLESEMKVK